MKKKAYFQRGYISNKETERQKKEIEKKLMVNGSEVIRRAIELLRKTI